ncbi:MAG TPA: TolC family protein [Verrucomicrobiae bacterium]|nr:TolC family protein [Verrucomicrobiae bacterium]
MKARFSAVFCVLAFFLAATAPAYGQSTSAAPSPSEVANPSPYSGSVPSARVNGVLPLSLQDAVDRGLKQNLGALLSNEDIRSARGERWKELSALLPNANASSYVAGAKVNLAEFGFAFTFPGVTIPTVVGPFAYYDSRAYLTQSLFDWNAIQKTHEATENLKAAQYTYKDARDLVVLAVGYTYLQAIADDARIETSEAEVKSAQAVYDQALEQVKAGTSPAIDALRAQVELKTRQQQLIQSKNDYAIQKLTLARVIGLAAGQEFELTDKSPYAPLETMTVEEAERKAYESRSDFQAALAQVRAAEYAQRAAKAERYPTLSASADYGLAGSYDTLTTTNVFDVRGTLNIPIFTGGKIHGDVLQAEAQLHQDQERLENLRAQIDSDVRTALLNLESSSEQVSVARDNINLAEETLRQSRDRFSAGVTDTVEVVQAEESVASAHENYISSLYDYNYAKISLARAMGMAEDGVKEYFKGH